MSMRTKAEQAADLPGVIARGVCADTGPWGSICTEESGHRYSCNDGSLDTSFNDRWSEDYDVPFDNHPCDCRCTECAAISATTTAQEVPNDHE
jgi:hypothetical protein